MNQVHSCPFCIEIASGQLPAQYEQSLGVRNRILKDEGRYIAIPTISPLREGHILICPKEHASSIVIATKESLREFLSFVRCCELEIATRYGEPLFIEHGIGRGRQGGCGISHAHLHLVPRGAVLVEGLIESIKTRIGDCGAFYAEHATSLASIAELDTYLIVGTTNAGFWIWTQEEIPSQLVRKCFADLAKLENWDWRLESDWGLMRDTYAQLSNG